jgi:dCTP deaminase
MILPDHEIERLARKGMITPFVPAQMTAGGMLSYGLSSFGYDARVDKQWKLFTRHDIDYCNASDVTVDPKHPENFNETFIKDHVGNFCIIPPHGFALAQTMEVFNIPRDVLVICMGKSTYARCGIIVNCTPLEPEWRGTVTLEFSNTSELPVKIYSGEGACQFLFLRGESRCRISYADRKGKYMDQKGVTLPRIKA